jgi:uncharacterized membrane protein YbhN (UPF0104 family)
VTSAAARRTAIARGALRRGPRLFATPVDEPRARRVSDAITVVGSAFGLAVIGAAADPPPGFLRQLERFLAGTPRSLDAIWQAAADVLIVLAVLLVAASLARRRIALARDLVVATVVAGVVWLAVGRIVEGSWPAALDALRAAGPPPWFPSARIALPGAAVLAASPHLTLPLRRLVRRLIGLAAISLLLLGATTAPGALAGVLVAALAAGAVHLVFGSTAGRPGLDLVRSALAELGVAVTSVGAADRQQAGLFLVDATRGDDRLVVKVYGRDAHDTALVSSLGRAVWYRELGAAPVRFGRLAQVEREAFLTLFTRQAGVRTDEVVMAGATGDDDALLVLRRSAPLLGESHGGLDDDVLVGGLWATLDRLHDAGIAHGQLDDRHLLVDGSEVGVVDLRGATLVPTELQRRTDEVQVLATTVTEVGEDRAVAAGLAALGPDGVAAVLPFLQPAVLTAAQRRRVREGSLDLDHLRTGLAEAIGTEPPALQQLRRVTIGTILRLVLPAVAVVMLITGVAGLDLDELGYQLGHATWWLVALGVLLAQTPRLAQAVSTLGASPVALPLGPLYALQLAISYVNVAVPTSAARIAVNIRFFQRHGVPPGAALAAGALDGFGGFIVQAVVLCGLLLFTSASLDLRLGGAVDSAGPILVVTVLVALGCVAVVVAVARLRRYVGGWARRLGAEALGAVAGLRSPRRLALLFGGNFASDLLFSIALGCFARAFGYPIGIGELLLVNISVGLLAGLVPVPGGIGVAEGGLTFGLVQAGMPEETALAAVLMYRLSTFYAPPLWGFFSLRWLERNQHL